jgi:hypothetical protein
MPRAEARAPAQAQATVTKTSSRNRTNFLENQRKAAAPETSMVQQALVIPEISEAQEIAGALAACQDRVARAVEAVREAPADPAAEADPADRARLFQKKRCTENGAPFFFAALVVRPASTSGVSTE